MKVKEHYDQHLSNFYAWMVGDFNTRVKEQEEYFKSHGIHSSISSKAMDLGCGHGIQSVALARLGFDVLAVDFNNPLLNALRANAVGYKVSILQSDITDFDKYASYRPDVITCMGDTVTHLEKITDVEFLIARCAHQLKPNGKFVISYRDYTEPLIGEKRFIHVKSDETRILTCFLEYFDQCVIVTDLLYEKQNGEWIQRVSSYPKLRISKVTLIKMLEDNYFHIESIEIINGMIYIVAQKQS